MRVKLRNEQVHTSLCGQQSRLGVNILQKTLTKQNMVCVYRYMNSDAFSTYVASYYTSKQLRQRL